MAVVWVDKKLLYIVTTVHKLLASRDKPVTVERTMKNGTRKSVLCPPCLLDYQRVMRKVDCGDHMIGYYNIVCKSKRWWKRVFAYYIFECSVLNAFLVLNFVNQCNPDMTRQASFREQRTKV